MFSVQTADQPDLNSVSVCSSYYSLWTDDGNCLLSYLDAHTKGNPQSSKMDNQLWKHGNVCCASCTINKYISFTGWFCWGKNMLPWLLTASLLSFSLSSPLMPSPPLSAPIDNDSSNMHSCSLTGRAFEIYCYIAVVLLWVWIQLGLCSLCVCCACCSPIWSWLCLKCLWYKPLQFWLRLRVWLPLGLKNILHLNMCLHPW